MKSHPTHAKKKLPMAEKVAWGAGGFSEQLAVNGLNNIFVPIYNIGFGLSSVLIGWAVSIPRFFDMISDPVMGSISDNHRSRFGRRRPFIFAGGILMAIAFAMSYMASPYWSDWTLFLYAVIVCVIFYLVYTVFSVPFYALGLELADDYDERADLQKYRMIFGSAASFLIPWLYKICLVTGEHIREVITSGQHVWYAPLLQPLAAMAADDGVKAEVIGVRYVVWAVAILIILTALPAAIFTREKLAVESTKKINLLRSGLLVLKNRSFRTLCLMIFLVITGMFFLGALMTYINIFYVAGGDKSTGATWNGFYGTVAGIAGVASAFVIPLLVRRFDKKKVLMGGLGLAALAVYSSWFTLSPAWPSLQILLALVIGAGMSACWLLNGAFIADICDEDEFLNGSRREGVFAAFFGFVVKLGFTSIALLLGYVLLLVGYQAGADLMSPETVFRLRLFVALFPSTCLVVAMIVFSRYSLSRGHLQEIQEALRLRRLTNTRQE
jgi:GPH family glycoside/pentoside/hexuronide:cation symporter